jgi:hypothetical protein
LLKILKESKIRCQPERKEPIFRKLEMSISLSINLNHILNSIQNQGELERKRHFCNADPVNLMPNERQVSLRKYAHGSKIMTSFQKGEG